MTDINEVYKAVSDLAEYGIRRGLITERDRIYTINRLLAKLKLDNYENSREDGHCTCDAKAAVKTEEKAVNGSLNAGEDKKDNSSVNVPGLEEILKVLLDHAAATGLLEEDLLVYRDIFDTELMDCLTPRPGEIAREFARLYAISPKQATDWYYDLSRATDYIRTYRIAKDIKWTTQTEYGELVITINLSKPEKDPKAIAAALNAKQAGYPKCQLCCENEGYAGRIDHPARANHRIIPVTINGAPWFCSIRLMFTIMSTA